MVAMLVGNQERSMRPGTPVTPLIIGLAKAIELAEERREAETARLKALQEYFFERIEKEFAEAEINGSKEHRVPNNINVSFPGLDAESLLLQMDAKGIAISTRSACLFGTEGGSFVVTALGKDLSCATSSIRFTMGKGSTKEHVDRTIEALEEVVALARESQKLAQMAAISTS
jgi:cysteine desulfurase